MKILIIALVVIVVLSSVLVSASSKFMLKVNSTEPFTVQQALEDIKANPFVLYFKLGVYYFNQGQFGDAIKAFEKAIKLKPDFAEAYHNSGVSYYNLGKLDAAIQEFQKSIEVRDTYVKGHFSLALAYYEKKEYELALSEFKRVVELDPQNAEAYFNLGIIYVEKYRVNNEQNIDDLKQGLEYYSLCVEINPEFPHAQENKIIVEKVLKELSTQ